jgi:hypothetical protein
MPPKRLALLAVASAFFCTPALRAGTTDLSTWPDALREEIAGILSWPFNDRTRPLPPLADPLPVGQLASTPPAGAIVLFDGKDLSAWQPSSWRIADNFVEITPGKDYLVSKQAFGSCRIHLEWWTPPGPALKIGQDRGNSGIFLMGRYEVQVLDSYQNITYADGLAGSVYGQHPPRVNPARPPGEWQYYDIEFIRPLFDASGRLVRPARITVDFNGVRVQDRSLVFGPTNPPGRRSYTAHADALPLQLQNHREVVRFRNIWIVPLAD